MRRIGPLFLALALCLLASLAAPPPAQSLLYLCPAPVPACYADQDCNAYCQSACPATPQGACVFYSRLPEDGGFCGCTK